MQVMSVKKGVARVETVGIFLWGCVERNKANVPLQGLGLATSVLSSTAHT